MMISRLLALPAAFALFVLSAGPALALSCMGYTPQHAFQDAAASSDRYVIAVGRLEFNEADLPVFDMEREDETPPNTYFAATMTGFSLTGSGFNARFVRSIRVNAQCYGPWCASLRSGREYLAFLKSEEDGFLLETNPCGGFVFIDPTPEVLDAVHNCLLGKGCEPF